MAGVHIVTDSGSDITAEEAAERGITVVPLTIRFGEEEFVDRVTLGTEAFYEKMANTPGLPGTAAPAPGLFAEAFEGAIEHGATGIVCINLAGKMSATIESARNAAASLDGKVPIAIVDSDSITGGLRALVLRAATAADAGQSVDEITDMLADRITRTRIWGAFDTLENLKMGGRIGGAQALVGTLLSIKPIIEITAGEVNEAAKQRTRRKALRWIRDKVGELGAVEDLTICDGLAPDVDEFTAMFDDLPYDGEIPNVHIGATIGTHGGPRVMGVSLVLPPDAA
jgi:DegV family protein with EDD domain